MIGFHSQILDAVRPSWLINRFQEGHEVSLTDSSNQPVFGRKVLALDSSVRSTDATCIFQSSKCPAGCVLFPSPKRAFQLKGKLCHTISGIGDAGVGFFFSLQNKGPVQRAIVVRYNDVRPPLVPREFQKLLPQADHPKKNELRLYPLHFDPSQNIPDTKLPVKNGASCWFESANDGRTWREFEITVLNDEITVNFERNRGVARLKASQLTNDLQLRPFFCGDIGIYAFDSAVEFRDMFIVGINN